MTTPLIEPDPPDPLLAETRAFWREIGQEMVRSSLKTVESTAQQIIAVSGILEGLYFHAITFSTLSSQPLANRRLVFLAPLLLLLLSLAAALAVFFPNFYQLNINSSEAGKTAYEHALRWKLWLVRLAAVLLLLGVGAVSNAVAVYLFSL